MLAIAEQVPVEQQPKAVVHVSTLSFRVGPVGSVGRWQAVGAVNLNVHRFGLTDPARNDPDATLDGVWPRNLQVAGRRALSRGSANTPASRTGRAAVRWRRVRIRWRRVRIRWRRVRIRWRRRRDCHQELLRRAQSTRVGRRYRDSRRTDG